jgi:purine-binding chemotaxis protein CheW
MNKGKTDLPRIQGPLPPFGLAEEILGLKAAGPESPSPPNIPGLTDKTVQKYVTFYLGKEEYGLPISEVQEINRVGEITRVPHTPPHVLGVINLRGKIIPVIELRNRLNLGEIKPGKESRIVVVESGPKLMGMLVDRVSQVLSLDPGQIESAPQEAIKGEENYLRGVGKIGERMIIILDLQKVIGKESNS